MDLDTEIEIEKEIQMEEKMRSEIGKRKEEEIELPFENLEPIKTELQKKGYLEIGTYVRNDKGHVCQVLTNCEPCDEDRSRDGKTFDSECQKMGKVQKLSCQDQYSQDTDRINGKEKENEKEEEGGDNMRRLRLTVNKNSRNSRNSGNSKNGDRDNIRERWKRREINSRKESGNGRFLFDSVNEIEDLSLSSVPFSYDIYVGCSHTHSEDLVYLVRFQTVMALLGGIFMYLAKKQSMKNLSLFDKRKYQSASLQDV